MVIFGQDNAPYMVALFIGLIVFFLIDRINILRKPFVVISYLIEKQIGYGSCIRCGKKITSMWLLSCNACYEKELKQA